MDSYFYLKSHCPPPSFLVCTFLYILNYFSANGARFHLGRVFPWFSSQKIATLHFLLESIKLKIILHQTHNFTVSCRII